MTARRRLLRLAPLVAAGFTLGIAIPRAAQVAHVHAGGQRAHVHLGGDAHDHGAPLRRASHHHDHSHAGAGHHHHHGDHDHGHGAAGAHALVVPHDAAHVHWQAPFQRAVPAALPPVVVLATAGSTPATAAPRVPERVRPSSRSRGPPRA
ncbi:MAG: hypothetical protein KIT14_09280 [bacterium]|nr:hypothetical protein [bacterium]